MESAVSAAQDAQNALLATGSDFFDTMHAFCDGAGVSWPEDAEAAEKVEASVEPAEGRRVAAEKRRWRRKRPWQDVWDIVEEPADEENVANGGDGSDQTEDEHAVEEEETAASGAYVSAAAAADDAFPMMPPTSKAVPTTARGRRRVSEEELAELRMEQLCAEGLELRWQDRGPGPPPADSPHDTWRGQKYRQGTGRYANSGGTNRVWYACFINAKTGGTRAMDDWFDKNAHQFKAGPKSSGGPKEWHEWRRRKEAKASHGPRPPPGPPPGFPPSSSPSHSAPPLLSAPWPFPILPAATPPPWWTSR